jgi:hypothetical protein
MANMLGLLPHLSQQEIEMIAAVGFDHGTLALFRRDRLDIIIDALLEAERRGLFETAGAARSNLFPVKTLKVRFQSVT